MTLSIHSSTGRPIHSADAADTEAGHRLDDSEPIADAAPEMSHRRDHLTVDEHTGPVDPREAAAHGDAETAQHVEPADGPIEGVGAEVDVEAVAMAGAGPAAEVLGSLDHGHGVPVTGQRGRRGQSGEPAADDDRSISVHDRETIEAPAL